MRKWWLELLPFVTHSLTPDRSHHGYSVCLCALWLLLDENKDLNLYSVDSKINILCMVKVILSGHLSTNLLKKSTDFFIIKLRAKYWNKYLNFIICTQALQKPHVNNVITQVNMCTTVEWHTELYTLQILCRYQFSDHLSFILQKIIFYPTEELFFLFNYFFILLDGILYKPMTLQQDLVSSLVFVEFYEISPTVVLLSL